MSFKSKAQRDKFAELIKQGKITQKLYDEFTAKTPKNLPERVTLKTAPKLPKAKRMK